MIKFEPIIESKTTGYGRWESKCDMYVIQRFTFDDESKPCDPYHSVYYLSARVGRADTYNEAVKIAEKHSGSRRKKHASSTKSTL